MTKDTKTEAWEELDKIWERGHIPEWANDALFAIKRLLTQERAAAHEAGKAEGREEIWRGFQHFLAKYSVDRPIPPSELRLFLGEFEAIRTPTQSKEDTN